MNSDFTWDDVKFATLIWDSSFPIFLSEGYLSSLSENFGWVRGISSANSCVAWVGFTYYQRFGIRWCQVSDRVYYQNATEGIEEGVELNFVEQFITLLKSKSFDFIIQSPPHAIFKEVPKTANWVPFGTYTVNLTLGEKELWDAVHAKHRNLIRNAEKNGVSVELNNWTKVEDGYSVMQATMNRQGLGFVEWKKLDLLIRRLTGNILFAIAWKDNKIQGCALVPWSLHSGYYLYGGSVENPQLGAMNLIQWIVIRWLKERGCLKYDFVGARVNPIEGSKQEGIQRFKQRFGANMEVGKMWRFVFSPIKYKLYKLLLSVKIRQKYHDIIDCEMKG